jgi:hypothetical protein
MNRNKKTKNVDQNKAIDNMGYTNTFESLKTAQANENNNSSSDKKTNGHFK